MDAVCSLPLHGQGCTLWQKWEGQLELEGNRVLALNWISILAIKLVLHLLPSVIPMTRVLTTFPAALAAVTTVSCCITTLLHQSCYDVAGRDIVIIIVLPTYSSEHSIFWSVSLPYNNEIIHNWATKNTQRQSNGSSRCWNLLKRCPK